MLGILSSADFFKELTISKIILRTQSEFQTVWIQISGPAFFNPDLAPNCLQMLTADVKSCHQRVRS